MRFILLFLFFTIPSLASGQHNSLELKVSNIKEIKGQIIVSIYNNAEDFPNGGKEFKKVYFDVKNTPFEVQYIDLPKGEYAIALLHDENEDSECNFNLIGMPTEGYGFSKNIKPVFTVPSFDETKFQIIGDQSIEIKLIH